MFDWRRVPKVNGQSLLGSRPTSMLGKWASELKLIKFGCSLSSSKPRCSGNFFLLNKCQENGRTRMKSGTACYIVLHRWPPEMSFASFSHRFCICLDKDGSMVVFIHWPKEFGDLGIVSTSSHHSRDSERSRYFIPDIVYLYIYSLL